ncbi:ABC transporter ATP-binding protein [Nicoliella spurrieriana]|uniref:ABC transporter ATP-binding protein n=1 Tax=Nicoliella spurrieriana TaxID=2925830 RepID=A0A976RSK3_9LACO|nr:ABC transporter ATP-binding protein [Nicoliella spurrieriana]UQS87117.1 ABC transporter ATP-binding protein [Nicoliella spurrieriana]
METIKLDQIEKIYGRGASETKALSGINFTADAGELVSITGPSGSGKSTFLKLIGGILSPTSGELTINGQNYNQMTRAHQSQFRLDQLGFILQSYNLVPYLTVREQFELVGRVKPKHNLAPAEFKELCSALAIGDLMNDYPDQLSGGQQQRVAIARAMYPNPSIILADEPTAALDGKRAVQIMEIFQKIAHHQNKTVLLITHDSRLIKYVDRNYQIVDGHGQFVSKNDQSLV